VAVGSGTGSADSLGNVTFTTVSSVSLNDVFSSGYQNYKVVVNVKASTNVALQMRYRVSNADNSVGSYSFGRMGIDGGGSTNNTGGTSTSFTNICNPSTEYFGSLDFNVYNPFASERTTMSGTGSGLRTDYTASAFYALGCLFDVNTSFTGFTLFPSTGTITGTIRVFGITQ
jgi:hypothetical protein